MTKCNGYLEILEKGFGFLRQIEQNFRPSDGDTYVPLALIRRYHLREGARIEGVVKEGQKKGQKQQLLKVEKINGLSVDAYNNTYQFHSQTTINPADQLNMQLAPNDINGKILNLLIPVGKGQRGLVVAPPKAGKTTVLKHIAKAITQNHPDVKVIILLVDERPEEVTDFKRSIPGAQVVASSSDEEVERHIRLTRLIMQAGMREAEAGNDIVILMDSLTRMGRAFNKKANSNGRTLSGGLAVNALDLPRKFFGAARNLEDGGSLTIIASILVDTGSRMDDIIFQEFKGTGNMDLILSQKCAERRLWPAYNLRESGTRKEEKLLSKEDYVKSMRLRQLLTSLEETEAIPYVKNFIKDKMN